MTIPAGLGAKLNAETSRALAARLRDTGQARAARFSWEDTARRTLDIYKTIL